MQYDMYTIIPMKKSAPQILNKIKHDKMKVRFDCHGFLMDLFGFSEVADDEDEVRISQFSHIFPSGGRR